MSAVALEINSYGDSLTLRKYQGDNEMVKQAE